MFSGMWNEMDELTQFLGTEFLKKMGGEKWMWMFFCLLNGSSSGIEGI